MLKKLALALVMALGLVAPAVADNRINWYFAQNPPVDWLNYLSIYHREADGQKTLDFMGQNTALKYTNMTLSPTGSSFMGTVSAGANAYGSIYQYTVVDAVQVPPISTGVGSIFVPPNANQIMNQATLTAPVVQGPFTPPVTAGQSIIYLVEGQISTVDQVSLSGLFYTATGTAYSQTINRERDDTPVFQTKASAASTSPTIPSTDSGWVCIASIRVLQGTPANLSGATITPCPAWQGFADSSDVAHLTGVLATGSTNISGTSSASQFVSTVATGAPPLIVSSTTPVANLSIGGNAATATSVSGIVPVVNGGTGTATPALIAGNGITVSGAFPNSTIALAASPALVGLNLSGLNASQCVRTDGSKNLASSSADCLIGLSAGLNGAVGSGTSPTVGTISNPSFTAITDTGLTASSCVRTNAGKVLTSAIADCIVGVSAGLNIVVSGTFVSPSIATTTTPTFTSITDSGLTSGLCVQTTTGGLLTTAAAACGSGGGVSSVVGSAPITVGLVSGTATVGIGANPIFTGLGLSLPVCTDGTGALATSGCSSGAVASVSAGNANLVISPTTGAVVATLAASPSITSVTLSGATPLALSGTSANTITSASTGLTEPFVFNATASPNANIFDLQEGGSTVAVIDNTGTYASNNNLFAVNNIVASSGTVTSGAGFIAGASASPAFTMQGTTSNTISSSSTGATTGFIFNNTGSASTLLADFQKSGTSEWKVTPSGATTQTGALAIAGTITGATTIAASSSISAGSATQGTLNAGDLGASRSATSGAVLIGGSTNSMQILTSGSVGATLAFNGSPTFPEFDFGGQVTARQSLSATNGYVPPVFLPGGGATNSVMHLVANFTITGTGTAVSIPTLSGAAAFSNSTSWGGVCAAQVLGGGAPLAVIPSSGTAGATNSSVNGVTYWCMLWGG